jgi:hypothetical protein
MSLRRDLRHGGRIGRAEFVRSVRGYLRDTRRVVGLGIAGLLLGANFLLVLPAIYALGGRVRSLASVPYFEPAATLLPIACFLVAALRTMEVLGGVEAEELLLTTVHPRAVVVGLVTAEVGRLLFWFGLPSLAVAAAFAAGLGSPSLLVTAGAVLVPLVCCAAVWGYAVGIGGLRVLRRLPTARRALKVVGVAGLVGSVVLSQAVARRLVGGDATVESVLAAVSVGPLVDYLAVGFVATPLATPFAPVAAVVFVGWVGLTPLGLAAAERQATALWLGDAGGGGTAESTGSEGAVPASGFAPPRPFSTAKTGRVAWGHLVRAVRHPQELSHLLVVVFFAGPAAPTFLGGGEGLPTLVAGAGVGLGTYLSGATFGLNPLGDDRPQFPLLLLTETTPRTLLRGRVVAGLAVGLPVAVIVPIASVAAGTRPLDGVVFAVVGGGTCLAAAVFALGVGCGYPIYEEREIWGAETVAPSLLVLLAYSMVVLGGTAIGLVLTWFALTGSLAVTPVLAVGVGLYLLPTVGVPLLSYRYALGRYRRYTLD